MDAKTVMRSRMREAAQKRRKIIDSPLVRYNDLEQPVCKVCNVIVKSETLWAAHISSRQHKAAVDELKAKAANLAPKRSDPPIERVDIVVAHPSTALPANFFDKPEAKPSNPGVVQIKSSKPAVGKNVDRTKSSSNPGARNSGQALVHAKLSAGTVTQDGKQIPAAKGTLPEGFFDNQDADSRARGLEPIKLNIQDEYKEFQKSIKVDVQGVDVRLKDEEFDAAEEREEREEIEQRNLLERMKFLRERHQAKAAEAAKLKHDLSKLNEISDEESSDDDSQEEDNLFVDWRAKHI